jgi:hypothetical protein
MAGQDAEAAFGVSRDKLDDFFETDSFGGINQRQGECFHIGIPPFI